VRGFLAFLGAVIALAPLATAPVPASAAPPSAARTQAFPPARLYVPGGPGWNWQNPSPDANTLLSVSCPSASICYAAGYSSAPSASTGTGGAIYKTSDGGVNWIVQSPIFDMPFFGISCADTTHCMAVGQGGLAIATSNGSGWGGQRVAGQPFLIDVSCRSATICVAVGAAGTIMSTPDFGVSWTAAATPTTSDLYGVSCPSITKCIAVGLGGATVGTNDMTTWSALPSGNPSPGDLYAISCPSTAMCLAVGRDGTANLTTDGGATWITVANHNASLEGVSCPDTSHCFMAGADSQIYYWAPNQSPVGFSSTPARGALYGISCAAITTCFAVGEYATVVETTNGGTGWTKLATNIGETLTGISCPTATTCFASAWHIGDIGDVLMTADGGATWSIQAGATTAANNKLLTNISCQSTTFCVAVGDKGTIITTVDGGAHWASQTSGLPTTFLTAVSCPSASVCFAVGDKGALINTTDGGAHWTAQASHMSGELTGVSCPTTTRCFAAVANWIDPIMGTSTGPGEVIATTDGATWNLSFNLANDPNSGGGQFNTITCPTTTSCYAGGSPGLLATTSDGGANWRTGNTLFNGSVQGISCPTASVCYAASSSQEILYTTNAGGSWDAQWGGLFGVNLTSIACSSVTTCLTIDYGGTVTRTTTAGAAWSRSRPTGSLGAVFGLACTDPQNCYAAAEDALLSTHNGGTTWTSFNITTTDFLESISCPAAGTCFAVGWPGAIYATADGGTTWTYRSNPLSGADETLTGVSCGGPTTCVAVGSDGKVLSTTNGTTWGTEASGTTKFLAAVSCATTFNCVAVGAGGTALARSGGTWHAYASGTTKSLRGVDCPTAPICYAVGSAGTVIRTPDGGGTWAAQASGHTQDLEGIRCRQTTVCLAVGTAGTVIVTLDGSSWTDHALAPTTNSLLSVAWGDLNNAWIGGAGGTILFDNEVTSACGSVTGGPSPASTATTGSNVAISATTSGCIDPTYEIWLLPPGGSWTLLEGWTSTSVFNWDTSNYAAGSYRISVWARDLSSTNTYDSFFAFQYTLTVTVCSGIAVTSSPSSTAVQRGQPVQFTASTTGCPNPRYEFWLLPPGGSWGLAQAYSSSTGFYWSTFVPEGTYRFSVWVRDASSSNSYDSFTAFPFTITGLECTGMSATSSPLSPTTRGMTVMFTGTASGCPSPQYEFWLKMPAGNWLLGAAYSNNNIWDWSTSGQPTGTYRVSVWARDATSSASYDQLSAFDYVLNPAPPCTAVTVMTTPNTPQDVSTSITLQATATGCSSPVYEFWLLPPNGTWTWEKGYFFGPCCGPADTFVWNTSGLSPGTYRFSVWARDAASTATYDSFSAFNYVLTTTPCTGMTATASPATSTTVSTPVTITASATGCTNPQFEVWVSPPGGPWTLVRAYGPSGTITWSTSGRPAGTYRFSVWARDGSSSASYDVFSAFNYTLTIASCTAMTASASPPTSASVGTTVTISASATGCPNPVYEVWVLPPGGTWTLGQPYSPSSTVPWYTSGMAKGTYRIAVWARDTSSSASYDVVQGFNYTLT
jgi:photosystem II stability/assembly factor-like uncharacterized protein